MLFLGFLFVFCFLQFSCSLISALNISDYRAILMGWWLLDVATLSYSTESLLHTERLLKFEYLSIWVHWQQSVPCFKASFQFALQRLYSIFSFVEALYPCKVCTSLSLPWIFCPLATRPICAVSCICHKSVWVVCRNKELLGPVSI